jgi:UDP-N-acetylmuramoyl-tripeptide--D-alanyl-D-alanine ligase
MTRQPLWTAKTAAQATGGRTAGTWTATGVSIDSRTLEPGDLFVALEGPNFDGHRFVRDALEKGAAAAVVHATPPELPAQAPLLEVRDTLAALENLGRAARRASGAQVVGVTGSVGKTGTKEALAACLAEQGRTHAATGSFNNHWGLPLTLARLPVDADYAVVEMGMNNPGELARLTEMARPDVALITTVQAAHIENFDSVAAIAAAKAEILDGVTGEGAAVLPRDNPHYAILAERARARGIDRVFDFGAHPDATVREIESAVHATYSTVHAEICGRPLAFTVSLPGRHWVDNALGILAVVEALAADTAQAADTLGKLSAPARRGERHTVTCHDGSFELIDDSYNANPSSMRAALAVLGAAEGARRLAALGDMKELGADSARYHADLADSIASAGVDLVFTCGDDMAALREALPGSRRGGHAPTSAELASQVAAAVRPGDTVLVKGSAGACMGEVVAALRALGHGERTQPSDSTGSGEVR